MKKLLALLMIWLVCVAPVYSQSYNVVSGDTPSGSTDSGSAPVKIGGTYNSPPLTFASGQVGTVQIDTNGFLKTNGSGAVQPVSGTFWQATQPVSGTFWQTTQPVSGTFWQTTQPVSGTFWQATQPVSGTFWQTTQPVSEANLDLAQGSTTSGQKGPLVQGAVTTAAPTYSNGQTSPFSLDTSGNLRVVSSGSGSSAVQLLDAGGTNKATIDGTGSLQTSLSTNLNPAPTTMLNAAVSGTTSAALTVTGYNQVVAYCTPTGSCSLSLLASVDGTTFFQYVYTYQFTNSGYMNSVGANGFSSGGNNFVAYVNTTGLKAIKFQTTGGTANTVIAVPTISPPVVSNLPINEVSIDSVPMAIGNGTAGGGQGVQRVTIASDSTGLITATANLQVASAAVTTTNPVPEVKVISTKTTYVAINPVYTIPATPTDLITLYGSGTKTIKVLRIRVQYTGLSATGDTVRNITLIKRSSVDTVGTPNAVTPIPIDSGNAAATATCNYYTANPTTGGTVGTIGNAMFLASVAGGANLPVDVFDVTDGIGQPIVLRGVTEGVALNYGGAALLSGSNTLTVEFKFTEE